jgi:hypothetical protein
MIAPLGWPQACRRMGIAGDDDTPSHVRSRARGACQQPVLELIRLSGHSDAEMAGRDPVCFLRRLMVRFHEVAIIEPKPAFLRRN